MRILRTVILSIGLAALATACGGKNKAAEETAPDNTGGDEATDDCPANEDGTPGDCSGGGDGMEGDPCAGGDEMSGDACEGGE